MRFVREYVSDNRYQTGQRPVIVETNIIKYFLIKLFLLLEKLFRHGRITLEKKCKEIEESTSTQDKEG